MAKVQCFDKNAPIDEVMDTLDRDGAVIYHKLLDADTMDRVRTDLESYIERSCYGEGEFWGFKTKRFGALVAKSRTFAEQVAPNPQILSVMERLLGPYCENGQFQLHVTQLTQIGPNETPQTMHRDDWLMPFTQPGPQCFCTRMWALTDFTVDNGATSVILGSHKWTDEQTPKESDEIVQAAMPKGSCLIYVGSIWHGGSANVTKQEWRMGMICGYSLGWLRQEENQYLAVPPHVARELPDHVQRLIGYSLHGDFLGNVEGHDPHIVLEDRYRDVMPMRAESPLPGTFSSASTSSSERVEATEEAFVYRTATLGEPTQVKRT